MTATDALYRFSRIQNAVEHGDLHRRHGRVTNLIGLIIEVTGLEAEVGELCHVEAGRMRPSVPAEVVGFRDGRTLLMPLGEMHGIAPGRIATATGRQFEIMVGDDLLGRVIDGLGRPIDNMPARAGRAARDDGRAARGARPARRSRTACRSACARSTRSSRAARASASASSPAPASASRR